MMKCLEIFSSSGKMILSLLLLNTILDVLACQISYENKANRVEKEKQNWPWGSNPQRRRVAFLEREEVLVCTGILNF